MATTVTVDATKTPNQVTVVTDQAYLAASVTVGLDVIPFSVPKNAVKFSGVTATLVSNDAKVPTTTFVYTI